MNRIKVRVGCLLVCFYGLTFDSHYDEKWWWWLCWVWMWCEYCWDMSKELYQLIKDWRDEKNKS